MKWCSFFFAVLPVVAFGQTAAPDKVSKYVFFHEAGVICAPPTVGTAPAPDTVAGTTHIIDVDPPFVSTKRRVPAVIGIGFGIKVQANDAAGIPEVTMLVTHPPMGKSGATTQTYQSQISGTDPSLTFYQFDFDYELVLGTWQIEASQGGRVLYRTSFEVVPPAQVPQLVATCGFEELLS